MKLPDWALQEENYQPPRDRDGFLYKSILRLVTVLSRMKTQSGRDGAFSVNAVFQTGMTLLALILTAAARNALFPAIVLAGLLVRVACLDGTRVRQVMRLAFGAVLFSAAILLPAVILGNPQTFTMILLKVFVSAAMASLLAQTNRWNALTAGLRFYHIPHLFILLLDITLKYIVLLGELATGLLQALRLRSVGRNRKKGTAFGGVLGVTFLKSQEMGGELYGAMCCRGFTGEYSCTRKWKWGWTEWCCLAMCLCLVCLFMYLESAM